MFSFRKSGGSTPEPSVEVKEVVTEVVDTQKIIEEIHNSFNGAADELLEKAKVDLSSLDLTGEDKASRLSKLGFSSNKDVLRIKEEKKKESLSKELMETVLYYKKTYPDYKFITEDMVTKICKKYGLVCGDVSQYIGFVPEKNLQEIESFSGLKDEDYLYFSHCVGWGGSMKLNWDYKDYKNQQERLNKKSDNHLYFVPTSEKIQKNTTLKICAPLKDMELKENQRVNSKMQIETHIPDPVVLHPCRGGYLVLTAWGDESEDPILQK